MATKDKKRRSRATPSQRRAANKPEKEPSPPGSVRARVRAAELDRPNLLPRAAKPKPPHSVRAQVRARPKATSDKPAAAANGKAAEPSFKKAFAAARNEQGAGGTFTWKGEKYTTDRLDDKPKAAAKKKVTAKRSSGRKPRGARPRAAAKKAARAATAAQDLADREELRYRPGKPRGVKNKSGGGAIRGGGKALRGVGRGRMV